MQVNTGGYFFHLAPGFHFFDKYVFFFFEVPITPIPKEDAGIIFVNVSGPDTFVLDDTLTCVKQIEKIVENEESIDNTFFKIRVTIWL